MNLIARHIGHIRDLFSPRSLDTDDDPTAIGNLALRHGWVTKDDVRSVMSAQARQIRMGDIFVTRGMLTEDQRDELMAEQARLRARSSTELADAEIQYQRCLLRHAQHSLKATAKAANELLSLLVAPGNTEPQLPALVVSNSHLV